MTACLSFPLYRQHVLTLFALTAAIFASAGPLRAEDAATTEKRIFEAARYLASDELEGRGVGSKGLDLAADYLAEQFRALGLKTDSFDGTPFQKFMMTTGAELGPVNEVALVGPEKSGEQNVSVLKLGENFTPMALGGSGKLDHPLVFVGYGITGKQENYDDYAGIDVKDKFVIAMRHEPQQNNPHSAFNGAKTSPLAPFVRKISNAYEHGAAGIIFVTDDYDIRRNIAERQKFLQSVIDKLVEANTKFKELKEPSLEQIEEHRKQVEDLATQIKAQSEKLAAEYDPMLRFDVAGTESGRDFPVLYLRRSALDPMIQAATGKDLAALERAIDEGPTPHSQELEGWRIRGEVSVKRTQAEVKNVVAVLEGVGKLAKEVVVIGAHYDHVGRGGPGSGAIDPNNREIHNGADDNGSGTATLLEVARDLAEGASDKPRRTVVFIAFTGEERGLIGSNHYTKAPLFKLEDTVAMLNMDMVGRLADDKLIIEGVGTATEFTPLVDRLNEKYGFQLTKKPGGFGPSDHAAFYAKKIPVIHFFTGTHKDYHRPGDDSDKLNVSGMRRIGDLVAEIGLAVAEAPERPSYQETKAPHGASGGGGGGDRPYFGSIPDFAQDEPGYALTGVTKGGPAERAGLRGGDIIIGLGESKVGNLEDFDSALRKYKAGDRVPVTVKRDGQEVKFEVTLEPAK